MKSYNLVQIIDFPTRVTHKSATLIDCIYLDTSQFKKVTAHQHINALSDHDAQIIMLDSSLIECQKNISKKRVHLINKQTLNSFLMSLQEEKWESVYNTDNVNEMFNNFQNILIRNFENSFPPKWIRYSSKNNNWITVGIKTSCKRKRELYLLRRNSINPHVIKFYNKYCSILRKVIIEAKNMDIRHQIQHSDNLSQTTWKIIKNSTSSTNNLNLFTKINTDTGYTEIPDEIAKTFNEFFIHVAENSDNKHVDINKSNEFLIKKQQERIHRNESHTNN
jgi:hypothetical protein